MGLSADSSLSHQLDVAVRGGWFDQQGEGETTADSPVDAPLKTFGDASGQLPATEHVRRRHTQVTELSRQMFLRSPFVNWRWWPS